MLKNKLRDEPFQKLNIKRFIPLSKVSNKRIQKLKLFSSIIIIPYKQSIYNINSIPNKKNPSFI